VYRRGCGIQVEYEEEEQDHSILSIFWTGLVNRTDHFFRSKAESFARISPATGRNTTIGFNYSKPLVSNQTDGGMVNEIKDDLNIQ